LQETKQPHKKLR